MVSQLTVGVNTFVTRAESDTYLEDSLRGAAWLGVAPADKDRALISAFRLFEKQRWDGTSTGVSIVATAVLASGGTGYAVNDILTFAGGTFGQAGRIQVTAVSGGVITTFNLIDAGTYLSTALPATPNTPTGGGGASASITLTFTTQTALHPRTGLTDCDSIAVDDNTVAQPIKDAQIELAFDLSQDDTLEANANTGSNVKKVGAGSAQVEFFRATNKPGESGRFPAIVQELLRCFTGAGSQANAGSIGSGTDACSEFDSCDTYDLQDGEGFP